MNGEYKLIIDAIARSLGRELSVDNTDGIDFSRLYDIAASHSVTPLVYDGLKKLNVAIPDSINAAFAKSCRQYSMQYVMQDEQLMRITDAFENNGIKNMPLKGSILRKMYPSPELRTSADIDILCDEDSDKAIGKLLVGLGYTVGETAAKDTSYLLPPTVNVEIHRSLMGDHPELEGDFADVWDRVKLSDGKKYTYEMTNEDFYVYMVTHAAKHYLMGGMGIRFVVDIWVFNNYIGDNINNDIVERRLNELGVLTFNEKINQLACHWFSGADADDTVLALGDFICDFKIFGCTENRIAMQIAAIGKGGFTLSRIFPPYNIMYSFYPNLKGKKVLLPFYWVKRIFRALFNKNSKFFAESKIKSTISEEKVNSVKALNEALGFNEKSLRY